MSHKDIIPFRSQPIAELRTLVPALFLDAGRQTWWKFLEYFTAHIRNGNTREAYGRAIRQFSDWCTRRGVALKDITPFHVAGYVEELSQLKSKPTVKQHLAAIRMLFDYLVTGQAMSVNPATPVRGPKHVVKKGVTPVLTAEEARYLFDSIDVGTIAGLRDRAMIAVMIYSFARIGAVVTMNVEDYFLQGKRAWFRLREKNGQLHDVPVHHSAEELLDAYLDAAGLAGAKDTPLFRTLDRRGNLTSDRMNRREALAMVKRRSRRAGLPANICCHTFRATGITTYLLNGGTLEHAQQIAAHESPRTTKLYDRTSDEVSLDEIEKIII